MMVIKTGIEYSRSLASCEYLKQIMYYLCNSSSDECCRMGMWDPSALPSSLINSSKAQRPCPFTWDWLVQRPHLHWGWWGWWVTPPSLGLNYTQATPPSLVLIRGLTEATPPSLVLTEIQQRSCLLQWYSKRSDRNHATFPGNDRGHASFPRYIHRSRLLPRFWQELWQRSHILLQVLTLTCFSGY